MAKEHLPHWGKATVEALMKSLRSRDPYTYGHCRRVSQNAKLLAQAAGLSETEQDIIEYSSLFHDLGKVGIPDTILHKESSLTDEEEQIMQSHPIKSVEIIQPLCHSPFFKSLTPGIRHHHEHIDGQGYPDGIEGEKIPLPARIILIVDTFDAMTSDRPYRKGLEFEIAYKELKQFAGRQFDAHFVKIFLQAHPFWKQGDEVSEEYIPNPFRKAA